MTSNSVIYNLIPYQNTEQRTRSVCSQAKLHHTCLNLYLESESETPEWSDKSNHPVNIINAEQKDECE